MSITDLRAEIADKGFGHAIVHIADQHIVRQRAARVANGRRLARTEPATDAGVLTDLSDLFPLGWAALRAAGPRVVAGDEALTPTVARLLSDGAPRSHMLHFPHLGVVYGAVSGDGLDALERHPGVARIHHARRIRPVAPVEPVRAASPPADRIAWGLTRMGAPALWAAGLGGEEIVIAHLDTGVATTHPALAGSVTAHMVFDEHGQPRPGDPLTDTGTHGTHTAGTLAGRSASGEPSIGMAPAAELVCATVIEGGDMTARVLGGMDWAVSTGARVLNMSLGVQGPDSAFDSIMAVLRAQEMLPVAAIGNEGVGNSRSPANSGLALSVGGSDQNDEVPYWSSSAPSGPMLCAPGVDIFSALPDGSYGEQSGSSMATPHVAGLAVLLMQARPHATIDQVQQAIEASCTNPANVSAERIGKGIPDALAALTALQAL